MKNGEIDIEYTELNKLIWKSEEEMQNELKERIYNWKDGYSKDGFILSASGKFIYRGVAYLVNVLRYYNHTDKFTSMSHRISDCSVNVEYPKETEPIVRLVSGIEGVYEFLYHDTNHSWNDNQTVEEQINECHGLAKQDIDNLLDGEISKQLDISISKLQELKKEVNNVRENYKVS